jgi:hypothetical protein
VSQPVAPPQGTRPAEVVTPVPAAPDWLGSTAPVRPDRPAGPDQPAGTGQAAAHEQGAAGHAGADYRGTAVTPQAPPDVRLLETIGEILRARPRWSQRPPSMAEAWEYSNTGDWTTEQKSLKRAVRGLLLLIAFAVTYPLDWWSQAVKQNPSVLLLTVAVLVVLDRVL